MVYTQISQIVLSKGIPLLYPTHHGPESFRKIDMGKRAVQTQQSTPNQKAQRLGIIVILHIS